MNEKMPVGWGFAADVAPSEPAPAKRGGQRGESDRLKHMRFALWASHLGHAPKPGEICDTFGVCYESARRLVRDWETLNQETK